MCATKLAGVIKHSFILRLEDFSEENLGKQASKILQSKWAAGQEFRGGEVRELCLSGTQSGLKCWQRR